MIKKKIIKPVNDWVTLRRKKPTTLSGLHLPNMSQSGRSSWYLTQDVPELGLKDGDQILPAPEAWLYKVNNDMEDDDSFAIKMEHIIASAEDEESSIVQ